MSNNDFRKERQQAIGLTARYRAPKTYRAIRKRNSCYPDILEAARKEIGIAKLLEAIKESGRGDWARITLRYLDMHAKRRQELIKFLALPENLEEGVEFALFGLVRPTDDIAPIAWAICGDGAYHLAERLLECRRYVSNEKVRVALFACLEKAARTLRTVIEDPRTTEQERLQLYVALRP